MNEWNEIIDLQVHVETSSYFPIIQGKKIVLLACKACPLNHFNLKMQK